ncbi:hypothetical protein ES708_17837 [subsurface metagenome]
MIKKSSQEQYIAKFRKSSILHEKAKRLFPRGVPHDAWAATPFPIYFTKAEGSHKWDEDGYEYIDYFGGHGGLLRATITKSVKSSGQNRRIFPIRLTGLPLLTKSIM